LNLTFQLYLYVMFTPHDNDRIIKAIQQAEYNTSGEIRLCVEEYCNISVLDRASFLFKENNMNKTKDRNGVLIYIALNSKKMAIIGDKGINQLVGQDFWDDCIIKLKTNILQNTMVEGIIDTIELVGYKLKVHFPHLTTDTNELDNSIIYYKKSDIY
jgi:uncharacterized membrane protein